ncbi:MAG TPA: hypothetical protein VN855_00385, partial [Candidatus Acidoferrum sp.]|nr:hypothetical protein [Candidatus Acidoferrum sp.]
GIFLLNDSGIEVEGIKIWGSPVQPFFHDWAFNRRRGAEIKKHWDLIPEDTEILVTHGPPLGILDVTIRNGEHVGCADLMDKILISQIKLHTFGHIHEGHGYKYQDGRVFVNASVLDSRYKMISGKPIRVVKGLDDTYLVENETIENIE